MTFPHPPVLSPTYGSWYVTKAELIYHGKHETFTIPEGFATDLASVPRALQWLVPAADASYSCAAVVHDWLCIEAQMGRFSRRDADGIFRRILRERGVMRWQRALMWAATRVGGRMSDADAREWVTVGLLGVAATPALVIVLPVFAAQTGILIVNSLIRRWS